MKMYFEGHAGFSLLILSPFMLVFGWVDVNSIMFCLAIAVFSSMPDIDLYFRPFVRHRGPTHTLAAGIIFGAVVGALFSFLRYSWVLGFGAGFVGTVLHIFGDALSYEPMRPLEPFSHREFSMGFFRSSNWVANKGLMAMGGLAFLFLMKHGGYF